MIAPPTHVEIPTLAVIFVPVILSKIFLYFKLLKLKINEILRPLTVYTLVTLSLMLYFFLLTFTLSSFLCTHAINLIIITISFLVLDFILEYFVLKQTLKIKQNKIRTSPIFISAVIAVILYIFISNIFYGIYYDQRRSERFDKISNENLNEIYIALKKYYNEKKQLPSPNGVAGLIAIERKNNGISTFELSRGKTVCPIEHFVEKDSAYHYKGGLDLNLKPPVPIVWTKTNEDSQLRSVGFVLYTDGSIKKYNESQWKEFLKKNPSPIVSEMNHNKAKTAAELKAEKQDTEGTKQPAIDPIPTKDDKTEE